MMTGGDVKYMDMCRNDMVSFLVSDQLTVFWLCSFCLYQSKIRLMKVICPNYI